MRPAAKKITAAVANRHRRRQAAVAGGFSCAVGDTPQSRDEKRDAPERVPNATDGKKGNLAVGSGGRRLGGGLLSRLARPAPERLEPECGQLFIPDAVVLLE